MNGNALAVTVQERLFRGLVRTCLRGMFACLGGLRIEGQEHVPETGGVIVAPNHVSHADPIVVGIALRRPAWFAATDELFAIPVLGVMARWVRAFPIRQDSPDRAALRRMEELLRSGELLVGFPEGHESLDGKLQPLQPGLVWLALRCEVPIVPVGIVGTNSALPPREWRLRHAGRAIIVRFGMPITPEDLRRGGQGREAVDRGCAMLRDRLLALTQIADDCGGVS